jgi:hypothetical protein
MGPPSSRRPTGKKGADQDSTYQEPSARSVAQRSISGPGPPEKQDGPEGPPQRTAAAKQQVDPSVTDAQAAHRRRQVRWLATIALVRAAYGPAADDRLVPPGPECCPRTCPHCPGAA